ncbi:hypothetical protein V3F56_03475 [Moorellaceae bacterium AZ2]
MTPYTVTAPQLAWHVLAAGNLTSVQEGYCRVCGGPLVGEVKLFKPSSNWMDEHQCACKYSDFICEGCSWAIQNRSLLTLGIKRALVISPATGYRNYSDEEIDTLLLDMRKGFDPPYIFVIRGKKNPYKKHLILEAAVSWGNPGYVTLVTNDDNFTVPVELPKLADAVEQVIELEPSGREYRILFSDPFWRIASLLARSKNKSAK